MVDHAVAVAMSGLPGRNCSLSVLQTSALGPVGLRDRQERFSCIGDGGSIQARLYNYYIVVGSLLGLYGDSGKENGNVNPKP